MLFLVQWVAKSVTFLGIKTFLFNSIFMQTRSKRKTHVVGHLSATALSGRKRAISLTSTHVHVVQNGEPEDAEIALVSTCISQPVPCSTFSNPLCEPCISQDAKVNVMKLERIPPLLKCSNVIFHFPGFHLFHRALCLVFVHSIPVQSLPAPLNTKHLTVAEDGKKLQGDGDHQ